MEKISSNKLLTKIESYDKILVKGAKKLKKIYTILLALILTTGIGFGCEACKNGKNLHSIVAQAVKKPIVQETPAPQAPKTYVSPLAILNQQSKYLDKPVYVSAKFDKFSTLGLDYAPAMRASTDYIVFLVQRNDVPDHNVPLSEVKFFLKREYAEKFIDLDTGDKIHIDGKMFSNALGDSWVDVDKIEIVEKVKKVENK